MRDFEKTVNSLRGAAAGLRALDMTTEGRVCDDGADAIEEILAKCVNFGDGVCDSTQLCTCYGIVRAQINLLKSSVPKWISVDEQLPKIGECGMSDSVYVTDGEYIASAFLYQAGDGIFWSCAAGIDIFYWCKDFPLPAPPKEKSDKNVE